MVPIGEVLHAFIPALVMAEIDELLEQHGAVLARDCGHAAVGRARAFRSMAGRARLEELRSVLGTGRQRRRVEELFSGGGSIGGRVSEHATRCRNERGGGNPCVDS
jgi:hypothetical protein